MEIVLLEDVKSLGKKGQIVKVNDGYARNYILPKKLGEAKVELAVKSGEGGKVFGSVSAKEIAAALKEQLGMDIDKKKLQLAEPIKTLGVHEVGVKLHKDVTATLRVHVTEQK